jgi:hypothetical protein
MVKNSPNQIVNLQNNFFLSQTLFFLILKRSLPVWPLIFYCASLFAQVSSENNSTFFIQKEKFFCTDLRLYEQKLSSTLSNIKNVPIYYTNLPFVYTPKSSKILIKNQYLFILMQLT